MLQTYASLSLLAAFSAYCFTDAQVVGKAAKVLAVAMVVAFFAIEAMALLADGQPAMPISANIRTK